MDPLTRVLLIVLSALAAAALVDRADAQSCRYQEMRLLQLQGRPGNEAALSQARALLDACRNQGAAVELWENDWGQRRREEQREAGPSLATPGGTIRTWCVRRCDGYYFPISFSTRRDRLEADSAACEQLCPAGDAELFYHFVRGQGPEQMQSLSGEAYTELERAFSYRTALDESCSCGKPLVSADSSAADDVSRAAWVRPSQARPPRPRPAPGADPETLLNRLGALSLPLHAAPGPRRPANTVRVILPGWNTVLNEKLLKPIPN